MNVFKRTYRLIKPFNLALNNLKQIASGQPIVSNFENQFVAEIQPDTNTFVLYHQSESSVTKLIYKVSIAESDRFAWIYVRVVPSISAIVLSIGLLVVTAIATFYKGIWGLIFPIEGLYAYFSYLNISHKVHEIGLMIDPVYFNSPLMKAKSGSSLFASFADLTIIFFIIGILYTIGFFTYIFLTIF